MTLHEVDGRVEQAIKLLRQLPYAEYLKTAHWQRVRGLALDHAGHQCELCSSTEALEVHLVDVFRGRSLTAVTTAAVLEWRTRRAQFVAASTVNREIDVLKAMLAKAVPSYLDVSPLAGLARLRETRQETRVLTKAGRGTTARGAVGRRPRARRVCVGYADAAL